jgi:hypothetical protein
MTRAPRRVVTTQEVLTPARTALDYELSGSWPSPVERDRFWSRASVPARLRFPPDPRKYLNMFAADISTQQAAKAASDAEVEAWRSARITWLRRQV